LNDTIKSLIDDTEQAICKHWRNVLDDMKKTVITAADEDGKAVYEYQPHSVHIKALKEVREQLETLDAIKQFVKPKRVKKNGPVQ
jgi:hypothetical protein